MKQLKYIFLILGTLIGAGFATGKEIAIFYAKYGNMAFVFLIISFFILLYFIYKIIKLQKINKIIINNKFINVFFLFVYMVFTASVISAFRIFFIQININPIIIELIIILLSYLFLKIKFNKLLIINSYVVPVLVFLFFIFAFTIIRNFPINKDIIYIFNIAQAGLSSILYPFINISVCLMVLIKIGKDKDSKPFPIALVSSLIFSTLMLIGVLVLQRGSVNIINSEMPFLELLKQSDTIIKILYYLVFFISISTSIFSCLYSFKLQFKKIIKIQNTDLLCLIIVYAFSMIGFANLIEYVYSIAGCLSIFIYYSLSPKSFFNRTYRKIHTSGQHTQN